MSIQDRQFARAQAQYDAMEPPWEDAPESAECKFCKKELSPDEFEVFADGGYDYPICRACWIEEGNDPEDWKI